MVSFSFVTVYLKLNITYSISRRLTKNKKNIFYFNFVSQKCHIFLHFQKKETPMLEATRQRNSTMIMLLKEFDRKQYPHHYVKESKIVELIETKE